LSTKTQKEGLALVDIFTVTLSFILLTALSVVLLQIAFFVMRNHEVERKTVIPAAFSLQRDEQRARLEEPVRWVNQEAGKVGMPIYKAISAVIRANAGEAATP
jgi:hypothetical protein